MNKEENNLLKQNKEIKNYIRKIQKEIIKNIAEKNQNKPEILDKIEDYKEKSNNDHIILQNKTSMVIKLT